MEQQLLLLESLPLSGEAVKMVTQNPFVAPELVQPLLPQGNPFDMLTPPRQQHQHQQHNGHAGIQIDACLGSSLQKLSEGHGDPTIVTDDEHSVASDNSGDHHNIMDNRMGSYTGPQSLTADDDDDLCFC
jgi:hypothetical protein